MFTLLSKPSMQNLEEILEGQLGILSFDCWLKGQAEKLPSQRAVTY
jgi:hypothetical protein